MDDAFIGEIRPFAFSYNPQYFLPCQGQTLSIGNYQALYSLIGNKFGGDGRQTFALPNLAGLVVNGSGQLTYPSNGSGLTYPWGGTGGQSTVTLTPSTMPPHNHTLNGMTSSNSLVTKVINKPGNLSYLTNVFELVSGGINRAGQSGIAYTGSDLTALNNNSLSVFQGGSQAHANMQPYLVLNLAICYYGVYPVKSN